MFYNFLLTSEGGGSCQNSEIMTPILIVVAVLFVVALFVLPMINNRRQKKNVVEQRNALSVGDTIETVGGIIGIVREIREPAPGRKELVIETGAPGSTTTITVDIQALYLVLNRTVGSAAASVPAPSQEAVKITQPAPAEPFEETVPDQAVTSAPENGDVSAPAEAAGTDNETAAAVAEESASAAEEAAPASEQKGESAPAVSAPKKSGNGRRRKNGK